jgi:Putative peptidoglycan binding domain/HEAT repeats
MIMPCRSALLLLTCAASLGISPMATDAAIAASKPTLWQNSLQLMIAQATPTNASAGILKLGSRGEPVKEVQWRLQQLGHYDGAIDGAYGVSTKQAVAEFQQTVSLAVDGRVGQSTWDRLRSVEMTATSAPAPDEAEVTVGQSRETAEPDVSSSSATDENPSSAATMPSATPATARESASFRRSWLQWGLLALVVLTGVGVLRYVLMRSQPVRAKEGLDDQPDGRVDEYRTEPAVAPLSNSVYAETSNNGHYVMPQVMPERLDGAESSLSAAAPMQETTRLPKINIGEELIKDLHNPDPGQRRKAIWELGQRGDSQAIQPLVDLMMDSDSNQRSLILAAIAEIGVRTLKPMNRALLISLQDESSEVRKNAIRDLTRIYDLIAQASQLLGHAANDSDVEVQETAQWALSQLSRIRTAPTGEASPLLTNSANPQDYLPSDQSFS